MGCENRSHRILATENTEITEMEGRSKLTPKVAEKDSRSFLPSVFSVISVAEICG